jgi:glycosyltransferase involved in cell wall biosynthesis
MRILYLSQKPAYPQIDGGTNAIARLMEQLMSIDDNTIDYLCYSTEKHPFDAHKFPIEWQKNLSIEAIPLENQVKFLELLRYFFSSKAYPIERYRKRNVLRALHDKLSNSAYDVLILDGLYSTAYLEEIKQRFSLKIYYRCHNVEHQIWKELGEQSNNLLKKIYFARIAKQVKAYELKLMSSIDKVLPVSPIDEAFFTTNSEVESTLIPIVQKQQFESFTYQENSLFFIGNMDWKPNAEGVKWFVKNVFVPLKRQNNKLSFHIAGMEKGQLNAIKNIEGVVLHGFVEDLSKFIRTKGLFVAPLLSGSGIKVKVLEVLSHGVPFVLSEKAAEGIGFRKEITFFSTAENAIQNIQEVLNDPEKAKIIGTKGFELISEKFSNELGLAALKKIFND